jgi:hypothetical protein
VFEKLNNGKWEERPWAGCVTKASDSGAASRRRDRASSLGVQIYHRRRQNITARYDRSASRSRFEPGPGLLARAKSG